MKIDSDELLTAPYAVRDIVVTYATPLQLHLSWTEPKVKNGELLKYTVTYNGTYNGKKTVSYCKKFYLSYNLPEISGMAV